LEERGRGGAGPGGVVAKGQVSIKTNKIKGLPGVPREQRSIHLGSVTNPCSMPREGRKTEKKAATSKKTKRGLESVPLL